MPKQDTLREKWLESDFVEILDTRDASDYTLANDNPEDIADFFLKEFSQIIGDMGEKIKAIKTDYKNEPNTFIDGMEAMRSDVFKLLDEYKNKDDL